MDSVVLIEKWRKRRQEILATLKPDLLKEYRQLSKKIRILMDEEMNKPTAPAMIFTPSRTPLWRHKETLIAFLKKNNGPASRGQIHSGTRIPIGTLSLLLKEKEFEQVQRGLWGLRKK